MVYGSLVGPAVYTANSVKVYSLTSEMALRIFM